MELFDNSGLPDYRLVPKHLEKNFKATASVVELKEKNVLPRHIEFPPMLKYMKIQQGEMNPKLVAKIKEEPNLIYRLAKRGEEPTRKFENGFGKPKFEKFVKGVNYDI